MQTDTQGTDQTALVEELAAAVGIEPDAPESDSEPSSTDQAHETETPPATPDATSADGTEAPADTAPPPPDATQTPVVDPFAGGEPFTFRMDGRQIAPDGAKVINGHVVIPEATWRNQIQNFVADRGAIRDREGKYQRELAGYQARDKQRETEVSALMAEVQQMFADPEAMRAKLEHWEVNGPLLLAKMEARIAKQRAESYEQREREAAQQEQEAALVPQLQDRFGTQVETWLADHQVQWQDQTEHWAGWIRHVWESAGATDSERMNRLFQRDPLTGQPVLRDSVEQAFRWEVARSKTQQAAASTTARKETLNAAAVAPPKPKAPPPARPVAKAPAKTPPRNAAGEFQKADEPFDPNRYLAGRKYAE